MGHPLCSEGQTIMRKVGGALGHADPLKHQTGSVPQRLKPIFSVCLTAGLKACSTLRGIANAEPICFCLRRKISGTCRPAVAYHKRDCGVYKEGRAMKTAIAAALCVAGISVM